MLYANSENCHKNILTIFVMHWWLINRMIYAHFQYRVNNNIVSWVANPLVSGTTVLPSHWNKDGEWFVLAAFPYDRCVRLTLAGLAVLTAYIDFNFIEACQ